MIALFAFAAGIAVGIFLGDDWNRLAAGNRMLDWEDRP